MENQKYFKNIIKGVMISIILTMLLLLILSFIMMIFELSEGNYNLIFGIVSSISLAVGAVIAAKYNQSKGWLTGLTIGLIFFIFLLFLSSLINGGFSLEKQEFYRLLINLSIGTVAGMLGVNL